MIFNMDGYIWQDAKLSSSHSYLLPRLTEILHSIDTQRARPIFELGCGNGSVANELVCMGWKVTGVDSSEQGIAWANSRYPDIPLHLGSAYDRLHEQYGKFPIVISLEVVEHVYFPRLFAVTLFELLEPGGTAIISTPYHGYWKNLALAVTGRLDAHFTALWDHGHIKFWSYKTLSSLLQEAGFVDLRFTRVGRIPPLAKSMIVIARKP